MTSKLARSSHGLDSGTDGPNWRRRGRCAQPDVNPNWWWAIGQTPLAQARHICLNHCPVLAQCRADAETNPPSGLVYGGILWLDRAKQADRRPSLWQPYANRCPLCTPQPVDVHIGELAT